MIEFMSSWAEQIVLAVIVATVIEMVLPKNKNKKYIQMVIGVYVLFNIISPIIENKENFLIEKYNIENYQTKFKYEVDQTSMDKRLKELYIEQLQNDIKTKVTNKGYDVTTCKVDAIISGNEEEAGIKKIVLKIEKNEENLKKENENVEDKLVKEVQKIKSVEI